MVDFKTLMARKAAASTAMTQRILTDSQEDEQIIKLAVREALAEQDSLENATVARPSPDVQEAAIESGIREQLKLDRLVADDFPFDPSQIAMIDGIVNGLFVDDNPGACGTGAAGTGKTTCTKKIIDRVMDMGSLNMVDLKTYFKAIPEKGTSAYDDYMDEQQAREDGESNGEEQWVPSVAAVGFTGRSTQMIKKNFPRSWHPNIMTIHRLLAFMPVWEEKFNYELQAMRKTMRFEPTYNALNKLPWDVILIDEAGMVGVDLWEQLRLALKPTCKIIMIGDINQLPPVHGRSIFGFAMGVWPSFELTKVHRQKNEDGSETANPIVENAWRVLKGQMPQTEGNFQMVKFDGLVGKASQQVRKFLPTLWEKGIYDPIRDTTITAINGHDESRGYALGQLPLNREFAMIFNKDNPRYIIDAGRERQKFAVGDKVMATKNDHEVGVTNGMTGIIKSITENAAWAGDRRRFGTVEAVNEYMREENADEPEVEISLEDMMSTYGAQEAGKAAAAEKKDRGPASHIVTVTFGEGTHAFDISFATLAEVASLMTAYVVTCHKMQGGESPVVVIVLHSAHKSMHFREWLYTAITRASEKCILLYTDDSIRTAISKQRITGSTLAQKVAAFQRLADDSGLLGAAVKVNLRWGGNTAIVERADSALDRLLDSEEESKAEPIAPPPQRPSFLKSATQININKVEIKHEHHHHHGSPEQGAIVLKGLSKLFAKQPMPTAAENRKAGLEQAMASLVGKAPEPAPLIAERLVKAANTAVVASGPVVTHYQAKRPDPTILRLPAPKKESMLQMIRGMNPDQKPLETPSKGEKPVATPAKKSLAWLLAQNKK